MQAAVLRFLADDVIGERGIRISVVSVQAERVCQAAAQGDFGAITSALAGIDGDASQSAFGKLRYLLVARIHIIGGEVGPETAFPQGEVRARFVVPRVFGLIRGRCLHVDLLFRHHLADHPGVFLEHVAFHHGGFHRVLQFALHQVGEHLHVVSSRTIAA